MEQELINKRELINRLFYSKEGRQYNFFDCDGFQTTISLLDLRKIISTIPSIYIEVERESE